MFQQIYNTSHSFCFFITDELITAETKITGEDLVRYLTTLIFLPNYAKYQGQYLILITDIFETDAELNIFKDGFYDELRKQGVENALIEVLSNEFSKRR